jgi:hypothetical protein
LNNLINIKSCRSIPFSAMQQKPIRTVPVVKSLLVMDKDTFVVGYKGYMAGDAALVLAEWIPIYLRKLYRRIAVPGQCL